MWSTAFIEFERGGCEIIRWDVIIQKGGFYEGEIIFILAIYYWYKCK